MRTRAGKEGINIVTLGCSKNVVDSEFLMKQIEANHLEVVHNSDSFRYKTAIINTCGFIRDSKQESVDTILRFIRAKEEGRIHHVFVMGCLSERYKKDLEKEIPDVDKYFGVNDIRDIVSTLGLDYRRELTGERHLTTPTHYAYVKISEGCDRSCAFCAIPLIRGKHLSKSIEVLEAEVRTLAGKGVRELILIAQDLTWYGIDIYKRQALPELLERLSDIRGIDWIRLHYAYPAAFPRDVIRVMKERENICNYLDIPFQHASDPVLALMRRNHTHGKDLELIDFIRSEIPDITLRTTLITGHAGEGEAEFDALKQFVRDVRFDRLGVFTYSEEEQTWAAVHYKDEIPEETKSMRAAELMAMQQDISASLNQRKVGKTLKVIVDGREGDHYLARTEADSPEVDNEVLIPVANRTLRKGHFYPVRITGAADYDLFGEAG
jgi:ribosomal protein S12 methylthiotransferase